jgi:hypothetical protein
MLLRFFKQSYLQQFFALFAIQLVLWGKYLIIPVTLDPITDIHPLFGLLTDSIGDHPRLSVIIAFCIVSVSAVLINMIMIRNELVPKNTLVPALIFVSLFSQGPSLIGLYPELLSIIFLLMAIDRILLCYGEAEIRVINNILSASLLVSLAAFSYLPAVFYALFIWIALFIFRQLSLRIWAISIIGLTLPLIYYAVYNYIFDKAQNAYTSLTTFFGEVSMISFDYPDPTFIIWGIIAIITIISLFYVLIHMNEWNVYVRRKLIVILWIIVITLPVSIYSHMDFLASQTFQLVPASMLISAYLSNLKIRKWQELIFLLFLLLILFNNHMY